MNLTRAGLRLLVLVALGTGAHFWVVGYGTFLTLHRGNEQVRHLFVSPHPSFLALCVLGAFAVLVLVGRWVGQPDARWARPLLLFWLSLLTFLAFVPLVSGVLSVVLFVLVDLRWWWTALVLAASAYSVVRDKAKALGLPKSLTFGGPWPAAALLAICATWVVAGTPVLRFDEGTHGDEPKYLRYCENFYQGYGLEVSSLQPLASLPPGFDSRFGRNFRLIAEILPGELRELASDFRRFLANPSHRFVRSVKNRGFITGKNGGEYQVHQPGLSLMMLPAYYIDRQLSAPPSDPDRQWPSRLYAVNAFFLGLYLLWIFLIYRLLRRIADEPWMAWVVALTVGLTMPAAAFPFQFYPEVAAGVLLFAVASHLLFPVRATPMASFFVGIGAGYLPWLHVRFSALAAVLVVFAVVYLRRDRRRLVSFMTGFAIPAVLLALYAYRLTGSVLPSAVWSDEEGEVALSMAGALRGSVAYLVDTEWGLLAHSPVYLLALPGYWLLARRRRDLTLFCASAFLSVLLPSAAHTLHAAGTTPNRLIVAVVPFGAIPLVAVIGQYARTRVFQALFLILASLSAQNALAYNWSHLKHVGHLVDHSFSGWKVNVLFPGQSRTPWMISPGNGWLYVAWVATLVMVMLAPARLGKSREDESAPGLASRAGIPHLMLMMTLALVVLGTVVATATGVWQRGDYRLPAVERDRQVADALDASGECFLCLSSVQGRITKEQVMADLLAADPALAAGSEPTGSARGYDDWLKIPGRIHAWYLEANGHEPSDEDLGHYLFQWREEHVRPDEIKRRIFSAAGKPVQ